MNSALYEGSVWHRRLGPVENQFRHRIAMAYVDLGELGSDDTTSPALSTARRGLRSHFARADYLGDPAVPLDVAVRDLVEASTGRRPDGSVRLLAHLRTAGWNFNPISLYYCLTGDGTGLDAVVFEVTSTPWGERHAYVVDAGGADRVTGIRLRKALHVSPFLPMDLEYSFSCDIPGASCAVDFRLDRGAERVFEAGLVCRRAADLDRRGLRRLLLRHPLMPIVTSAEIYLEAAKLAARRAPFYRHPDKAAHRSAPASHHDTTEPPASGHAA
jgi:DUF1365 family protein